MALPEQKDATLERDRPNICVITATPLTIHFFFRQHLQRMGQWADVTIVMNAKHNQEVMPLSEWRRTLHLSLLLEMKSCLCMVSIEVSVHVNVPQ